MPDLPTHDVPTHRLINYHTPMGSTFCSAVIGTIYEETPAVLLIERDDNRKTSITNAIGDVATAVLPHIEAVLGGFYLVSPIAVDEVRWFEAYEYRIVSATRYVDPAVMNVSLDAETWSPVDSATLELLKPFFAAFRDQPKSWEI